MKPTVKAIAQDMVNAIKNATTPEVTTPGYVDPMDAFTEAVSAAQGLGDIRLYRLVGVQRETIETVPASEFDPFEVGRKHGSGRYFAQFVQAGRILKSMSFTARGDTATPTTTTHAAPTRTTPSEPRDDRLMMILVQGMMQQQTALLQTLASRNDDGGGLLGKLLPILLAKDSPVELYKEMMRMADRHSRSAADGAPPVDDRETTWPDIVKELLSKAPALLAAMPKPAAAATPGTKNVENTAAAPAPKPAAAVEGPPAEVLAALEAQTGLPLSAVPEALRFTIGQGLPAAMCADIIGAKIEARGDEAEKVWQAVAGADAKNIVAVAVQVWPEFAGNEAYIRGVWAELVTIATAAPEDDEPEAQVAPPPPVVQDSKPAHEPCHLCKMQTSDADRVIYGNELEARTYHRHCYDAMPPAPAAPKTTPPKATKPKAAKKGGRK